ncbi:MAG TPA: RnfABCDGE type electron transport complex subunit D [Candidatus Dormibacteraeota bacterium]
MRQLRQALQNVPQLLLVQPEQLNYDLAFGLALVPLLVAAIVFFRQDAVLLLAVSLLAGVVCLLGLQLGRLSFGLPAWVGHRANHPLVASVLISCFLSPKTPLWLAAAAVILFTVLDTFVWPQLRRVMLHPALIVFGLIFIAERQLGSGFVNPFDGRRLADPLTLWYQLRIVVDPIKLYVGNVPGPVGATSAGAILIGLVYLWYARKVSLGIIIGFLIGVAVPALLIGSDVAFQLSSGPALFLAGFIAADRRRVLVAEPFTLAFGVAAGAASMVLRGYGQGQEATWESLLLMSTLVTVYLRVSSMLAGTSRGKAAGRPLRALALASGRQAATVSNQVRQPAMAMAPGGPGLRRQPAAAGFDTGTDSNDLVRQMRSAASRGGRQAPGNTALTRIVSLITFNPLGLWLTWTSGLSLSAKRLITLGSVLWYLVAAALLFALTHLR